MRLLGAAVVWLTAAAGSLRPEVGQAAVLVLTRLIAEGVFRAKAASDADGRGLSGSGRC